MNNRFAKVEEKQDGAITTLQTMLNDYKNEPAIPQEVTNELERLKNYTSKLEKKLEDNEKQFYSITQQNDKKKVQVSEREEVPKKDVKKSPATKKSKTTVIQSKPAPSRWDDTDSEDSEITEESSHDYKEIDEVSCKPKTIPEAKLFQFQ